jgi:uncharacterized protein (DUF488 family)
MYYRRKILLALMQQFGGSITRTDLQKLLFLYSQKQTEPAYHFIPYKFGCFSYQANQDVSTMIKYNQIEESNSLWQVKDKENYLNQLKMKDRIDLVQFYNKFKSLKGEVLIKYVYENYPYYALNSEIAKDILDVYHYKKVTELKPTNQEFTIFTIGYEGKSVEEYVNQLIKENVKVLCDVRKNPLSMKYGFSKNQLKNIVENIGIQYLHFPELGIDSDKRQDLNTKEDYKKLLDDYVENTLPTKMNDINNLSDIFLKEKRIALTCFEADYKSCHRSRTADALFFKLNKKYPVKHI